MKTNLGITVTIRKVSSGYKVTSFAGEDLNQLYSISKVLMKSTEYARCYCVALDWQGEQLFEVRPEQSAPAPYQAPVPQHHQPHPQMNNYGYQHTPQLPPQQQAYYPPPQQQMPQRQYMQYAEAPPQYVQAVPTYEGVIEPDGSYGARPALPGRR